MKMNNGVFIGVKIILIININYEYIIQGGRDIHNTT